MDNSEIKLPGMPVVAALLGPPLCGYSTIRCASLASAGEALARHNAQWQARWDAWLAHAIPPWWAADVIVTPDMRATYEAWLPYDDFRQSLCAVGRAILPSPDWLPLPLRQNVYLSLPDFWAAMPGALASKVTFSQEECLPLFCAMADPPRFGTLPGRYPQQLHDILEAAPRSLLDVACGVGLNTIEITAALEKIVDRPSVTGITSEPLEVWMAQHRTLPHDVLRQKLLDKLHTGTAVQFKLGYAENFTVPCDAIVCNGLVGGRFFHGALQYQGFLDSCRRSLDNDGVVFLANRFHEGARFHIHRFIQTAKACGFHTSGTWQNLTLRKKNRK